MLLFVFQLRSHRMPRGHADISGAQMRRRAQTTQAILEQLAEVDRHAKPWLAAVRQLIGSSALKSRVESAYRSGASPL